MAAERLLEERLEAYKNVLARTARKLTAVADQHDKENPGSDGAREVRSTAAVLEAIVNNLEGLLEGQEIEEGPDGSDGSV